MEEKKPVDKVVTESSPVIKQILLIEEGRGGMKIQYDIAQNINGVVNNKKRNEEVKRAVQREIREGFASLKEHLLSTCGYYWPNDKVKGQLEAKCVVTTVVLGKKDEIQIKGYMLMNGTHHAAIHSPFVTMEDYDGFQAMEAIVDKVCEESKLFMSGTKSADVKTIVVDYMTVKKEVINAEDAYSKMTQADIDEITREALQDSGLRIVMEDGVAVVAPAEEESDNQISMDIDDEDVETDELKEELKEDESGIEEAEEIKEAEFVDPTADTDEELFVE